MTEDVPTRLAAIQKRAQAAAKHAEELCISAPLALVKAEGHCWACDDAIAIRELLTELARLQGERDEARAIVANVNNSMMGSHGYFTKPDVVELIEYLKALSNQRYNDLRAAEAARDEAQRALQERLDRVDRQ